jgi:hypothetical protein
MTFAEIFPVGVLASALLPRNPRALPARRQTTWNPREFQHSGTVQLRAPTVRANHRKEFAMTAESKSPLEQVNDTLSQLKEMRHYTKNYVEQLTAQWLLFDGQLKKLKQAGKFEDLMTRQAEFHDALDNEIAELEEVASSLQPPPEEGTAAG